MTTFFNKLQSGDKAVSVEHGLVEVVAIEVRDGTKFITCETVDNDIDDLEGPTEFDAIDGELVDPTEWQVNSAISAAEMRLDNGAVSADVFRWLREEIDLARQGEYTHEFS